ELLLVREGLFSHLVPALAEFAFVLVRPLLRNVVRRMRGAGREVYEERLVWKQRLLLHHPGDALIRKVLGEVVPLLGPLPSLNRSSVGVQRRIPLIVFAANEAIEILEALSRWPPIEGPRRAGFVHRHFVALPELRRGVSVELECLCERR